MDVLGGIRQVQIAFTVIATLQLTAHWWPKQAHVQDGAIYDFIVIGAGSAGSVVASRLAEVKDFSVLLIEAGGDPPLETTVPSLSSFLPNSRLDWNYTSQDDGHSAQCYKNHIMHLPRGKVLGGTSSINAMLYVRGNPHDFDTWAGIVNDDTWSWNEVLKTYIDMERLIDPEVLNSRYGRFHGTKGPLGVTRQPHNDLKPYLDAAKELGFDVRLDINGDETLGFNEPMYTIDDGVRQSTALAYLSPKKDYPNLNVMKNTLVTRIIFDSCKNAVAVEVIKENKEKIIIRSQKEIILSAGALNSPQLLMLSGIGPKDHLESLNIDMISDLPVGKNLQDHTGVIIAYNMRKSDDIPPTAPKSWEFQGHLFLGYVALNKSQPYPDYQSGSIPKQDPQICSVLFGLDDEVCKKLVEAGKGKDTLFSTIIIFHQKSRGEVLLRSTNPSDPPSVYLGSFSDEEDLDDIVRYIEEFSRFGNTSYFKSVEAELAYLDLPECNGLTKGSKEYWKCYARCMMVTVYHYVGTCAMGSVLDSKLSVLGVQRLRVADASVMPTITSGNTNAPTIMIGEKAAMMIKKQYSVN